MPNVKNENIAGIGFMQTYGGLLPGILAKDNNVASIQSIYSTNGIKGVGAVPVHRNNGNWVRPNPPIPGYLAEYNTTT